MENKNQKTTSMNVYAVETTDSVEVNSCALPTIQSNTLEHKRK